MQGTQEQPCPVNQWYIGLSQIRGSDMYVMIDDIKNANVDVIIRNADAAIDCLNRLHGLIEVLLIDHDLGVEEPAYDKGVHKRRPKKSDKQNYGKKKRADGYDILMYAILNNLLPPVVQIVALNPQGVKRLEDALKHDAKYIKQGNKWIKPK
jgi:hypothetical protein